MVSRAQRSKAERARAWGPGGRAAQRALAAVTSLQPRGASNYPAKDWSTAWHAGARRIVREEHPVTENDARYDAVATASKGASI